MAWVGIGRNGRGRIYRWMVWPVGIGFDIDHGLGHRHFVYQKWV